MTVSAATDCTHHNLPIGLDDVESAARRIEGRISTTRVTELSSDLLNEVRQAALSGGVRTSGITVTLKCENEQRGGSFKLRGALNTVTRALQANPNLKVVLTHSSGNHGAALALAARECGIQCVVVVPENALKIKIQNIESHGARIVFCRPSERAKIFEEVFAQEQQMVGLDGVLEVPSYNHCDVMAGQGTLGLEIDKQCNEIDVVLCPIGGGGLISGVATAVKGKRPGVSVIGVEPLEANEARRSKEAGKLVGHEKPPNTIADGLKMPLKDLTWSCVRCLVDGIIDVTEAEIVEAMSLMAEKMNSRIEASSATVIAALLSTRLWVLPELQHARNIVAVISGGNVDSDE